MSRKKEKFYITTAIDYIQEKVIQLFNGEEKVCYFQKEFKRSLL